MIKESSVITMNNKGFSLIEILATMVILGILITLGLATYTSYQKKAVEKSYVSLRKNASHAAENYFMDHQFATEVTIEELVAQNYLENNRDPIDDNKECMGTVKKLTSTAESNGVLALDTYKVALTCTRHESCEVFPGTIKCDAQDGIVTGGEGDYYDMGLAGHNFEDSIAIAIRLKFNKTADGNYVDYFGNWQSAGGGLGITADDKFYTNFYSAATGDYVVFYSDKIAYPNRWYVVVGTLSGGKLKLYVDGVEQTTSTGENFIAFQGNIKPSPYGMAVGGNPNATGVSKPSADITVSDAIVFDEGLDASDISNYFSTPQYPFNYNGTKTVLSNKSF